MVPALYEIHAIFLGVDMSRSSKNEYVNDNILFWESFFSGQNFSIFGKGFEYHGP